MKFSLTQKVTLSLLAVALLPLLAVQWFSLREFEQTLIRQASRDVGNIADKKVEQIGGHIKEKTQDVELLASDSRIAGDLARLQALFHQGSDSAAYRDADGRIHSHYRNLVERGGYYDLFLISPAGDILFTVAREADRGTNLFNGPYRESELARGFRHALHALDSAFSRLAVYEPSGKPASFIATPVIDHGRLVGVLAVQLDLDVFERIANNNVGLGKSGATVVAHAEGNRIVFLFAPEDREVSHKRANLQLDDANPQPIQKALRGAAGNGAFTDNLGQAVIGAWRYVPEGRLGMVIKVSQEEALAEADEMRNRLLTMAVLFVAAVAMLGLGLGRRLIHPLRELNAAAVDIAAGRSVHTIAVEGNDEIAQLGESFNRMAQEIREAQTTLEDKVRQRTLELEIAQMSIVESERFMRSVLETIMSAVVSIDEQGNVLSVNRATETMFGYPAHEIVGNNVSMLMPEPHRSAHDDYLANYRDTGERRIIGIGREVSGRRKDGSAFPVELEVSEVKLDSGSRFFVGLMTDISARKAAAAQHLRQSRAIEESPVMVVITDPARNIEYVNPAFDRITGYDRNKVVGTNIGFMKSGNTPKSTYAEMNARLARGESWNGELENRRKDGSLYWATAAISPVRDENGVLVNYVSVQEDISERRKLQDELRRHRDHLANLVDEQTKNIKAIVDTAADAIITIDHMGGVLSFNAAAETMFGYRFDEVIGRNISLLMPEPYRAAHDGYLSRYVEGGKPHIIGVGREVVGLRKDGSTFPISLAVSEMDIGGEKRFTGIIRDISLQKEVEAALIQAREAAEAASRAKSNFLANMSHEIRTPMNAIIGMTDLVLDSPLAPEQEKLLRSVAGSAKALLTILNDILNLSKLEAGKMDLEAIPFSIRQLFEGVDDVMKANAAKKGLTLAFTVADEVPPCVLGDPTRLRQVLLNLIGNAVKFTVQGSVTVSARPTEDAEAWHFSVRDTGIGIASDRLDKVFERFSQADETTTRRFGGTGLGNSISREIVKMMGGRIWVESEVGTGSDFQFTARLPVAVGMNECAGHHVGQAIGVASRTRPRPLKILLAEDLIPNQKLVVRLLSTRGHTVVIAGNGRIAVDKFKQESFDLILMDGMMPEMDGEEATRAIRAIERERGGHIPIIMLTASVKQADQKKYFAAGADDFSGKPFDLAELLTKIARFFPGVEAAVEVRSGGDKREKLPLVAGLDVRAGVATWGDLAAYRKAVSGFGRDYADGAARLRAMFDGVRYDEARLLAHSLKGLAGNLGATGLAQAMAELERCAKENALPGAEVLQQAQDRLAEVLAGIAEIERQPLAVQAVAAGPIDTAVALPALDRLIEALDRSELDEEAIASLRHSLDAERFGQLEGLIDAFELARAAALGREIQTQLEAGGTHG